VNTKSNEIDATEPNGGSRATRALPHTLPKGACRPLSPMTGSCDATTMPPRSSRARGESDLLRSAPETERHAHYPGEVSECQGLPGEPDGRSWRAPPTKTLRPGADSVGRLAGPAAGSGADRGVTILETGQPIGVARQQAAGA
jgi:hypothetical protein